MNSVTVHNLYLSRFYSAHFLGTLVLPFALCFFATLPISSLSSPNGFVSLHSSFHFPSLIHPFILRCSCLSHSWLLASTQVGSLPRRIMMACITVSSSAGGQPWHLISVMFILFRDSRADEKGQKIDG